MEEYASCCSKRGELSKEDKDILKKKKHSKQWYEEEQLQDHCRDCDDVQSISKQDLDKLDRYCQFDKRFPFYKMDVNGFIHEINSAVN